MFSWLKRKLNPENKVAYDDKTDKVQKEEALYDYGLAFKASVNSPAAKNKMMLIKKENGFTRKEIFNVEDLIIGKQMDKAATSEGTLHEMFVLKDLYNNSMVLKDEVEYKSIQNQVEELKLSYSLKLDYLDINPDRPVILPDWISIPLNIILNNDEQFYYKVQAGLIKKKRRTKSISYGGITTSFRLCKGVHFRTGNIKTERESEEYFDVIDVGFVSVTNQRIIFMGDSQSFTIPVSKILNINFNNGICLIYKEGKEAPYMIVIKEDRYLIPIVHEVIKRYKSREENYTASRKDLTRKETNIRTVSLCNKETRILGEKIGKCKKLTKSTEVKITKIEMEAFNVIKHILKNVTSVDRIYFRDTTSYLSVLYDNKNYKWICRLKFKKGNKYIVLPNGTPNGKSILIDGVSDILKYDDAIIESAKRFVE